MYIVKKNISGKDYYYLQKSIRDGDKVTSKCIAYLGKDKDEAEKKAEEIKMEEKEKQDLGVKITYFVHGTTKDNENGISTGQAHGELSETGIKQSEELTKQIREKDFDVVFCSDLKRAVDSAEISFGDKYRIIQDKRLRECDYGDLNQAGEEKVIYEEHIEKNFPRGESLRDVEKRVSDFLEFLRKNYNGKKVAIVSHKAPQLALEVLTKGKTWKQAIEEDWRKNRAWQAGWEYEIKMQNSEQEDTQEISIEEKELTIEELANFCKEKGFVFRSSDIYGGFAGFWDFGPLGVELFNNIRQDWWNFFVKSREDMVGMEASVISHPKTWEASGHISSFSDVAVICKNCKKSTKLDKSEVGKVNCECGGEFEVQGEFSLMFKTKVGALDASDAYLRGETAQGMFMDFKIIQQTSRMQLPFGIAQIGRCFRNEIAPRDFLFRSREFHIGEFEYFINPEEEKCNLLDDFHLDVKLKLLDSETQVKSGEDLRETSIRDMLKEKKLGEWHAYWLAEQILWFQSLGLNEIKIREHTKDELSHYSSATFDIDYEYCFGSKEVAGNANRGQYDLKQHEKFSKEKMEIYDEKYKKKTVPRVIEPTFGMERVFLAILTKAYTYDKKRDYVVLRIPSKLAPVKAAVFPIIKKPEYEEIAEEIVRELRKDFHVIYDRRGAIGRRYARNDIIGTPYCITIDDKTPVQKDITIRDRDSTKQVRVSIKNLREIFRKLINKEIDFEKAGKLVETRVK
ncbi:glycine--tRNA ligase [Candidatus Pacearchaeota archaeon]|nr:glycine--tRNA ligase [Candidatus Pacearchaeota archaeon]MBD3282862.1 glycine--tRNA ligase [Candidatus Pacearchaeota archaeon]